MTEASLVMPLTILAVMSVVVILLVMYQRAGISSQLHRSVRAAAGEACGVWQSARGPGDGNGSTDNKAEEMGTGAADLYGRGIYEGLTGQGELERETELRLKASLEENRLMPGRAHLSVSYERGLLFSQVKGSAGGLFGGLFLLKEKESVKGVSALVVDEAQILRNFQFAAEKGSVFLNEEQ